MVWPVMMVKILLSTHVRLHPFASRRGSTSQLTRDAVLPCHPGDCDWVTAYSVVILLLSTNLYFLTIIQMRHFHRLRGIPPDKRIMKGRPFGAGFDCSYQGVPRWVYSTLTVKCATTTFPAALNSPKT